MSEFPPRSFGGKMRVQRAHSCISAQRTGSWSLRECVAWHHNDHSRADAYVGQPGVACALPQLIPTDLLWNWIRRRYYASRWFFSPSCLLFDISNERCWEWVSSWMLFVEVWNCKPTHRTCSPRLLDRYVVKAWMVKRVHELRQESAAHKWKSSACTSRILVAEDRTWSQAACWMWPCAVTLQHFEQLVNVLFTASLRFIELSRQMLCLYVSTQGFRGGFDFWCSWAQFSTVN